MEIKIGDKVGWFGFIRRSGKRTKFFAWGTVLKLLRTNTGGVRTSCTPTAKIEIDPKSGYPFGLVRTHTTISVKRLYRAKREKQALVWEEK